METAIAKALSWRSVLTSPQQDVPRWTFLTNHAHVLIAISRDPEARQTDIAYAVGITSSAVRRIIGELEEEGYLSHEKIGRRNRYTVLTDRPMRHPLEDEHTVDDLIVSLKQ